MQKQMPVSLRRGSFERIITTGWLGLLVLGILSNPLFSYPGRDGGIFLYVGSLILKGKIPYLDVWENKGPLVFYINALGLFLTNGSRWGVWLLEFLFFFCAGYIGYTFINRVMGIVPALIGTFIWITAAGNVLQGGNFSEEYSLLFSFVAALFYLKSLEQPGNKFYSLLIGVSLGLNILLRPNNIGMQAAAVGAYFVLAIVSRDWRLLLRRMVLIALGGIVVLAPVILYFALQDALMEMVNVVLVFNVQYSEGGGLFRVLGGLLNASTSIGLIFVTISLLGYGLSLLSFFKREVFETVLGKFLLILIIGWPIEAVLSSLSGRNYPHYFLGWAPYLGLLCAYVMFVLLRQFAPRFDQYAIVCVLILLTVTLAGKIDTWKDYGVVIVRMRTSSASELDYRDPVASYILENTSPGEKVFVWGFRPVVNFASDRESPASFLPYPLIHVDTPLGEHWASQFYSQFTTTPPSLIVNMIEPADRERIPDIDPEVRKQYKIKWKDVVLAHNYKDILEFIHQNYTRVDSIDGTDIYRLNSSMP
jgi:hypothetical protein